VKSNSGEPLNEDLIRKDLNGFGDIKQISIKANISNESQNMPVGFVVFASEEQVKRVFIINY
jgi:CRISPR/Cas system type I-B associated protein Csh2 (Cas7 group RAMP superfamily)